MNMSSQSHGTCFEAAILIMLLYENRELAQVVRLLLLGFQRACVCWRDSAAYSLVASRLKYNRLCQNKQNS